MISACFCPGDAWLEPADFEYIKSGVSISLTHSGNSFSKNEGIKENENKKFYLTNYFF